MLALFFEFVITRYQGDIHALTGVVVDQPIDEFNRQSGDSLGKVRVPPSEAEIDVSVHRLASRCRSPQVPARGRDYFAASLWRRLGLRINETVMLDIRDWRPDLGAFGKLHVRLGKGKRTGTEPAGARRSTARTGSSTGGWPRSVTSSVATGPTPTHRCCPASAATRNSDVRRVGTDALRHGLVVRRRVVPAWSGRLTPHVLRHYCASSLYVSGMDLKALQELLGHHWLATTSGYIHVRSDHIERAWTTANQRLRSPLRRRRMSYAVELAAEGRRARDLEIGRDASSARRAGLELSAGKMSALWTGHRPRSASMTST